MFWYFYSNSQFSQKNLIILILESKAYDFHQHNERIFQFNSQFTDEFESIEITYFPFF